MKKKIFYWSPCLDRVGTVISTINSAISLSKYGKDNDVRIINVCGEWDQHRKMLKDNSVNIIDLNFKYFKILPKKGFIRSRFSYIVIYLLSFFPLFFLLSLGMHQTRVALCKGVSLLLIFLLLLIVL